MRHWFAHWTESVKKVAISKAKRPPEKVVVLYISALLPHNKVARDGDALRLATLTRYDILLYQFFVIMFNKSLANTSAFTSFQSGVVAIMLKRAMCRKVLLSVMPQ